MSANHTLPVRSAPAGRLKPSQGRITFAGAQARLLTAVPRPPIAYSGTWQAHVLAGCGRDCSEEGTPCHLRCRGDTMSILTSGTPRTHRTSARPAGFTVLACMAVSLLSSCAPRGGAVEAGAAHTPRRRPVPLTRPNAVPRAGRPAALAPEPLAAPLPRAGAAASPRTVRVIPNRASGQSAGTTVRWTATAAAPRGHSVVYRFSVGVKGGPLRVVRDFSPAPSFDWTPLQTGDYTVVVTTKEGFAAPVSVTARTTYLITSRVKGSVPVVTATTNPLVALYSAPACRSGHLRVQFRPALVRDAPWTSTAAQRCQPGHSLTFTVAGMRADTTYLLRSALTTATGTLNSSPTTFTTGRLPSALWFPNFTVPVRPHPRSDRRAPILLHMLSPAARSVPNPVATDLGGECPVVLWDAFIRPHGRLARQHRPRREHPPPRPRPLSFQRR